MENEVDTHHKICRNVKTNKVLYWIKIYNHIVIPILLFLVGINKNGKQKNCKLIKI